MEIRVLRYFLAIVREGSITRAADVLHITQPTLSRQIAQLEDELGVKLFSRDQRKIALTNEGRLLRRRAEEILELTDKTALELTQQEEQIEGKITIGVGELTAMKLIPELLRTFRERYPHVTFELYTANADLVRERMDHGLVDVGVLLEPVDVERYDFIRLPVREHFAVLMRADDPLAEKTELCADDLKHLPLILPVRSNVQNEISSWFGAAFSEVSVPYTTNFSTNGALFVEHGLGYSITLEGSMPFLDKTRLVFRPLCPELTTGSVIAWRKNQPYAPAMERFIEHIRCFKGIIQP